MAISLKSLGSTVNTGISQISSALNNFSSGLSNPGVSTVTRGTNFDLGNGLNSSLRSASALGSTFGQGTSVSNGFGVNSNFSSATTSLLNSSSNPNTAISALSQNLNSALTSGVDKLQQFSEGTGAINRVSQLAGNLSSNPNIIPNAIGDKLGALGFQGLTADASRLLGNRNTETFSTWLEAMNPVEIIQRSASSTVGAIGGEFEKAIKKLVNIDSNSFFGLVAGDNSGNSGYSGPPKVVDPNSTGANGASNEYPNRIENPLRYFNHYNYIFTLGVLDNASFNSPDSYRNANGFKTVVLKSGGGERLNGYANRVRTAAETGSMEGTEAGDAEYFIDDVSVTAVVAPNRNTGTSLGTNVTFTVIEPFSMGKFIEAMMIAAQKAGYSNYIDAPFCLKIEFCGWDERGETDYTAVNPYYIPIKLVKTEFDVGQQGSTYSIKAVPYNETGLTDEATEVKTTINAAGSTPVEVLETSRTSVTSVMNDRIQELENKKVIAGYDRYIVVFPKDKDGLLNAVRGQNVNVEGLRATYQAEEQERIRQGRSTVSRSSDPDTPVAATPIIRPGAPDIYLYLKAYASDPANMNEIGRSRLLEDSRDGAPQPMPSPSSVNNEQTGVNQQQNSESQVAVTSRSYQFNKGDKILNIIEKVITNAGYAKDVATAPSDQGFKKWFRIETFCFIESGGNVEKEIGRPRRIFVYAVQPFYPHESRFLAPGEKPNGIKKLKQKVVKEYNYYYTGKNEDVLDFNIKFNNAFFNNIRPDIAQGREDLSQSTAAVAPRGTQAAQSKTNATSAENNEAAAPVGMSDSPTASGGGRPGSPVDGIETRIAQAFHNTLINGQTDMITAEMEIWGDPYYLPTDLGNYSSSPSPSNPGVSSDGSMNYMRNEVYILINFQTPIDYRQTAATMELPTVVKPFSGIYQVMSVTANFAGGVFKQTLKLVRMRGQNDESTSGNTTNTKITGAENSLEPNAAANAPSNPYEAQAQSNAAAYQQQANNAATRYRQIADNNAAAYLTQAQNAGAAVSRVSSPVLSGPDVVYVQELLTTGNVQEGIRTTYNNPTQNVQTFLRDNPEVGRLVAERTRASGDRTVSVRNPQQNIFPTPNPGTASGSSSGQTQATYSVNGRTVSQAEYERATAIFNTNPGTRPPVGPR